MIRSLDVPVDPDAAEGRRLLQDELAKQPYVAARPTPFDRAAKAFGDWLSGLFKHSGDPTPSVLLVLALVVIVALVVVAVLLYGMPRVNRRSAGSSSDTLFGGSDRRTAAELRAAARAAGAAGDFTLATLEWFRAVARGLDERTLVAVFPGTTATGFARSAGEVVPDERFALADSALTFDRLRYAGVAGVRADADTMAALDDRVQRARPRLSAAQPA